MVPSIYGGPMPSRNGAQSLAAGYSPAHPSPSEHCAASVCSDDDLLVGPAAQMLVQIARAGSCGLGELVAAIPDHPRPLAAVIALVDAGLLALDLDAPLGPDMRVWCPGSPAPLSCAF